MERLVLFTMPAVMEPSVLCWGRATEVMVMWLKDPKVLNVYFCSQVEQREETDQ
jgi:hypothetical protein